MKDTVTKIREVVNYWWGDEVFWELNQNELEHYQAKYAVLKAMIDKLDTVYSQPSRERNGFISAMETVYNSLE